MTTTAKAPAYKFTTNVPVAVHIKYVDVRPGKLWNDPKTGQSKKLPAQVSIKGTFDGVETIAFLPGKVWKVVKALASAGIIDAQDTDALEAVDENTSLAIHREMADVIATLAKPAGAKYEDMEFQPKGVVKQQPKTEVIGPRGRSAGPHIPGLDDDGHDDPPVDIDEYEDVPALPDFPGHQRRNQLPGHPPDAPLVGEEPALTPREERERAGAATVMDAREADYLALMERVALRLADLRRVTGIAFDGSAVQAATFSLWGITGRPRS